jgi:hypothetical protein
MTIDDDVRENIDDAVHKSTSSSLYDPLRDHICVYLWKVASYREDIHAHVSGRIFEVSPKWRRKVLADIPLL